MATKGKRIGELGAGKGRKERGGEGVGGGGSVEQKTKHKTHNIFLKFRLRDAR